VANAAFGLVGFYSDESFSINIFVDKYYSTEARGILKNSPDKYAFFFLLYVLPEAILYLCRKQDI
jgi:hypothetical protein